MEIGQGGVYVGKASIRRGLDRFGPAELREGEINDYVFMQPIVTVATDGELAKARGVYLGMTGRIGAGAEWREGLYENEYVRDGGVWKIQTMHVYPRLVTDYDKGWAQDAKPVDPPSAEFPPDQPPTSAYESYPKFVIAPFHFRHPVTGRPPQYPDGHAGGDPSVPAPVLATATPARTEAELDSRLTALERSLGSTASVEAAANLLNAYGYYADERMWDAAARLFAPDAWAAVPGVGIYTGRDRLRTALQATFGGGIVDVSIPTRSWRGRFADIQLAKGTMNVWLPLSFNAEINAEVLRTGQIENSFAELKPKTRDIFLMSRMEGLTYTQIAVRVGLTPSAVEKHMAQAIAHFVRRLKEPK
jgi:hypothetical protein